MFVNSDKSHEKNVIKTVVKLNVIGNDGMVFPVNS